MSATADRYHEHDANRKGHVAGLYGDPKTGNPCKPATGTWVAWDIGWRAGHKRYLKMKRLMVKQ